MPIVDAGAHDAHAKAYAANLGARVITNCANEPMHVAFDATDGVRNNNRASPWRRWDAADATNAKALLPSFLTKGRRQ